MSVAEPEPHHFGEDGTVTRCSCGPNLIFIIGGLLKMSQTVTVSYFSGVPFQNYNHFNHARITVKGTLTFV
jgi:hypothetical protein